MINKEPLIVTHSLNKKPNNKSFFSKKDLALFKQEELIKRLSKDKIKSINSLSSKNKPILIALIICLLGASFSVYMGHSIIINWDENLINKLVFYIFVSTFFSSLSVFFGLVVLYIRKIIKLLNEKSL
jgi:hypothetical protein